MSVYVDHARIGYGYMKMSHMLADTPEELRAMADTIKVHRRHIQKRGTGREHFDICMAKRSLAIKAGAIPVSSRRLLKIIKSKELTLANPHQR